MTSHCRAMIMPHRDLLSAGCRLEPIKRAHREDLRRAAADPEIWRFMRITAAGRAFDPWFDDAVESDRSGRMRVYAVRAGTEPDATVVGSTGFLSVSSRHCNVELGHTWLGRDACGTHINAASKLLLLTEAFDAGAERVVLRTDSRNTRCQKAIEKLGATFEGIQRRDIVLDDGFVRDTACYAILKEEWPDIRRRLAPRAVPTWRWTIHPRWDDATTKVRYA